MLDGSFSSPQTYDSALYSEGLSREVSSRRHSRGGPAVLRGEELENSNG
jgi:hypothetical protein